MSSGAFLDQIRPSRAETTATADLAQVDFSYLYSIPTPPATSKSRDTCTLCPSGGQGTGPEPSFLGREQRPPHSVGEMSPLHWADDLLSRFPEGDAAYSKQSGGVDGGFGWDPVAGTANGHVRQIPFTQVELGLNGGEPTGVSDPLLGSAPWPSFSTFGSLHHALSESTPSPNAPTCSPTHLLELSSAPRTDSQGPVSPFSVLSQHGAQPSQSVPSPAVSCINARQPNFHEAASTCPTPYAQPLNGYVSSAPFSNRIKPPTPSLSSSPPPPSRAHVYTFSPRHVDPFAPSSLLELNELFPLDPQSSSTPSGVLEKAQPQAGIAAPESLLPTLPTSYTLLPFQVTDFMSPPRKSARVWWEGPMDWNVNGPATGSSGSTTTTTPPSAPEQQSTKGPTFKREKGGAQIVALGPIWHSEIEFFGRWETGPVELLDAQGKRLDFTASIIAPARVRFDTATRTWITYRRNNLSLDVSLQLPAVAPFELYTTDSASPVDRLEVEWMAVTALKEVEVELLQFDKERRLSQAQRLKRQRLAPRSTNEQDGLVVVDVEDQIAQVDAASIEYSTHFQRVRYSESTSNHPLHRRSPAASFVMLVSLFAVHADGTESRLGGWTSVAHAVRGSSPKRFGEVKRSSRGVTSEAIAATSRSSNNSVVRSPAVGSEVPNQSSSRPKKAGRCTSEYKSAAIIEDSDVELEGA